MYRYCIRGYQKMTCESSFKPTKPAEKLMGQISKIDGFENSDYNRAYDKLGDTGLSGGDDDVDDDALVDELPSRRKVLKATSLINQYINAVDDPVARKLEAHLDGSCA
jgi:hypothetical protein